MIQVQTTVSVTLSEDMSEMIRAAAWLHVGTDWENLPSPEYTRGQVELIADANLPIPGFEDMDVKRDIIMQAIREESIRLEQVR